MKQCTECGLKAPGGNFCTDCGGKMEDTADTKTPPRVISLRSHALTIDWVYADIIIEFVQGDTFEITVDGQEEMKAQVAMSNQMGDLYLNGELPGYKVRPRNPRLSHRRDSWYLNDELLKESDKLTIYIKAPRHCQLEVRAYVAGTITFLNDGGEFTYTSSGQISTAMMSFETLSVIIAGSGDVKFADSRRDFKFEIHGSGDLTGNNATCSQSSCLIQGSGNTRLESLSGRITLEINGSGDFTVENVNLQSGSFLHSGSCDVHLESGVVRDLLVNIEGSGDFLLEGRAEKGSFSVAGSGDIEVTGGCRVVTRRSIAGSGDIDV